MDEAKAACAAARAINEEDREQTNRARAELGVEPLPKGATAPGLPSTPMRWLLRTS